MGRHPVNQRLYRAHSNGFVDLQSHRLAVSAPLHHMANAKLTNWFRFTWGIEMTCETAPYTTTQKNSVTESIERLYPLPPSTWPH